MSNWRLKYYAIQAVAFLFSLALLAICLWVGDSPLIWAIALVAAVGINALVWWLKRLITPKASQHLTPREWGELRGALEDVPVLSVLHIFAVDRSRLEQFRYIPTLKRYLWESLAEERVDPARVVRAAFLLHTFGEALNEYIDTLVVVPDAIVRAYIKDLAAEPGQLQQRTHLALHLVDIPDIINRMTKSPEAGVDHGQEAAWRLMLFGPLALDHLRGGLEHPSPRVRESCLALLALQPHWEQRHKDVMRRINHDGHPSIRRAALELLASSDHPQTDTILKSMAHDPLLGGRVIEMIRERQG